MPRTKTQAKQDHPSGRLHACEFAGCTELGEYKAPKSRQALRDYQWLCLEHVREYNKSWDYFDGMGMEKIEAFRKDAVTGHRPTWNINQRVSFTTAALEDGVAFLMGEKNARSKPKISPLTNKERKALALFDFTELPDAAELKRRYKQLVKRTHPDVNMHDPNAAERFKQITVSYKFLMQTVTKNV